MFDSLSVPTVLLYCLALSAALIYLPFLVVGYARLSQGYDMSAPRAMFDKLPDYGKRATWAHQNSFETFVTFAVAAIVAYVTGQDSLIVAGAAIAFVASRLLYSVFYILNVPLARSLMFAIGSTCTAILFVTSLINI